MGAREAGQTCAVEVSAISCAHAAVIAGNDVTHVIHSLLAQQPLETCNTVTVSPATTTCLFLFIIFLTRSPTLLSNGIFSVRPENLLMSSEELREREGMKEKTVPHRVGRHRSSRPETWNVPDKCRHFDKGTWCTAHNTSLGTCRSSSRCSRSAQVEAEVAG